MVWSSVRRPLTVLGVLLLSLAASAAIAACGTQASDPPATLRTGTPGRPIPSGFVGLSTEIWAIPQFAGEDPDALNPAFEQLVRNLAPGQQPVIRLGGDSTDWTWWPVPHTREPLGIRYTLTPLWLQITKAFVKATHARLILGINLEANSRRLAGVEARQLVSGLGASSVRALEIGNEPELYGSYGWYRTASGHEVPGRSRGYSELDFENDFAAFSKTLPSVPLAGPSTGSPTWEAQLGNFLRREPRIGVATVHAYPLKHCVATNHVTIGEVLANSSSEGLAARVAPLVAIAHAHRLPLRIDEINSVSCGGQRGVSDTYATALWSLDTLFALARAGVDGVNIHTPPRSINQMFTVTEADGAWHVYVHPVYYGMLMFAQATPPGSRLLRVASSSAGGLSTWATLGRDGTRRVVVINKDTHATRSVVVDAPMGAGTATLELMRAPSITATTGITIGGQGFGADTSTGQLA
ncbi:MAG TPA: glycosyl hydrolase family 79 C-terminal domain-containing protein, partial [Solirubrobacteraceae bacterium]